MTSLEGAIAVLAVAPLNLWGTFLHMSPNVELVLRSVGVWAAIGLVDLGEGWTEVRLGRVGVGVGIRVGISDKIGRVGLALKFGLWRAGVEMKVVEGWAWSELRDVERRGPYTLGANLEPNVAVPSNSQPSLLTSAFYFY